MNMKKKDVIGGLACGALFTAITVTTIWQWFFGDLEPPQGQAYSVIQTYELGEN